MGPWGVFRGRPGARGSRSLPIGGGGGEVGSGGEVGGGGEVQKRCTSQGGAKPAARERPNAFFLKARPRGDPAVHPTPTAKARLATPTVRLPRCLVQLRRCLTGAFERCIELPEKRWSPTQRPGGDPAVSHPTPKRPNAQATQHPTPKNEPLRIATPTSGVLQNDLRRHLSKYLARRPRRRRPIAPNAHSPPNAQNVARASRPNAHGLPKTQRQNSNPFRSMPHSSLRVNRRLRPRP